MPELFRRVGYATFNNGKDDYNFTYDRADLYSIGNPENTRMPFEGDPRMMSLGWKGPRGRGDWQDVPKGVPFFGQIGSNGGKGLRLVPAALEKAGLQPIDPADVDVPPQYPDIPGIRAAVAGTSRHDGGDRQPGWRDRRAHAGGGCLGKHDHLYI